MENNDNLMKPESTAGAENFDANGNPRVRRTDPVTGDVSYLSKEEYAEEQERRIGEQK